jgi:hypothetical protein
MEDDYYYLEEETDFRPFLENEMDDPTNGRDDEDNYEYDEPYTDDMYLDADAYRSIGWGTDEDYGHYDDGGDW